MRADLIRCDQFESVHFANPAAGCLPHLIGGPPHGPISGHPIFFGSFLGILRPMRSGAPDGHFLIATHHPFRLGSAPNGADRGWRDTEAPRYLAIAMALS